jgi:hypothetical protein
MSDVVLGVHPTVPAAYQAHKEAIGVSTTALDHKLDRVEPEVSAALVHDAAALAEPVVKALRASPPRGIPGYHMTGRDGHHLAATEHRLKAWRGPWAAPLPGQALVVLDQQRLLMTAVMLHADGQAQERRMIAQGRQLVEAAQRWSADRHVCPLGLMVGRARRGAACVVRQHAQVQGELLGRAQRIGTTRRGPVSEQTLHVRDPTSGETLRVRRLTITLTVPTRDGDTERHILANVPSGRASATHLARVYGKRWSIETAFCEMTTTLACAINPLAYPTAALFPCCLALLASNAVALLNAALRSHHGRQKVQDEVSGDSLSLAISRTYDGMMMAIPALHWALFRALSHQECASALHELASSVDLSTYQKHPRGPQKRPPERAPYQHGQHVATAKLLAQR